MKLDWPAILLLSLPGVLMGALSLVGVLTTMGELGAWTLIALGFWVPYVVARRTPSPLVTLLVAGAIAGVWTGAIQAVFTETLLARNAAYATSFPDGPVAATRAVLAASAVGVGAAWGALFGGVAWGVRKARDRRAANGEAAS